MFDKYLKLLDTPFAKRRIGSDGDGGYVIIDNNLNEYTGLVGLGIKDDNNFEKEFQEIANCKCEFIIRCHKSSLHNIARESELVSSASLHVTFTDSY